MKIRLLDSTDAVAYQRLRLRALRESPAAFSASLEDETDRCMDEVAARVAAAADGSICTLGVFEHDELVGFVAVIHPQRQKLRHQIRLAGMYVAPEFRRHGIGRALLDEAVARARRIEGVLHIKLGVNATNMAAKALYRAAAFECYAVEPAALKVDGTLYDEEHYVHRLIPVDRAAARAAGADFRHAAGKRGH